MIAYELLYIIPTRYTDTEIEGVMGKIAELLGKSAASIQRHENLGKIKLAYPIKRVRHGTYVLVHFDAEPSALTAIDRELRLAEEVLRHQIIILPKGAAERKYELNAYVAPLSEEARREEAPRPVTRPRPALPPPLPAPLAVPSLTMEELDKKLDEILENDISKTA